MADEWYYAHDANKIGPVSGRQLKNMAFLGDILRTDTIWKEGVEKGVLADKVKNLFSLPPECVKVPVTALSKLLDGTPPAEKVRPAEMPLPSQVVAAVALATPAATLPRKPAATPNIAPKPARKGKAVATKGADIVSQDGIQAKYRKKCTVCGHKDQACQTIKITTKTTTINFYCPKCRKSRDVTIQCTAG